MQDSSNLDELDRKIVAALQVNGRASWHAVAQAVGGSETRVARRTARLFESGTLKVIGMVDLLRSGSGFPVLLRISCAPGQVEQVAIALTKWPHTRFVAIATGTADCLAEVVVPSHADLRELLTHTLPVVGGIVRTETLTVLRTFISAHDWDPGLLPSGVAAALRQPNAPPRGDHDNRPVRLTDLDWAIIRELSEDGRMPLKELAGRVGVNESTAGRRVDSLVTHGCLRFRTLIEPKLLGFATELWLWLSVNPGQLEQTGKQLAEHHAVKYLAATSGGFHLAGEVALRHHDELYGFTTEVIGALPGVRDLDITIELETFKRVAVPTPAYHRAVADHGETPAGGHP